MDTIKAIASFLAANKWLELDAPDEQISFLAAGEYNENYRISVCELYGEAHYVFRINHGSQLRLKNQIEYEYTVLRSLARSGVTPRPYYCDPEPARPGLGNGVMLMEFIPGRALDYAQDWEDAARVFAAVHSQPINSWLISQPNPILAIAHESEGMIQRYPNHPMPLARQRLLSYMDEIVALGEECDDLFKEDPPVIVNTEVNSGNFLVHEEDGEKKVALVDWEKAVISSRFQDIGHFLVPTTTLWKTDYRFNEKGRRDFVRAYRHHAGLDMDLDTAMRMTDLMERTILLRAMSWCYMAYFEYTRNERKLQNSDTFKVIQQYLDQMECFFAPKN